MAQAGTGSCLVTLTRTHALVVAQLGRRFRKHGLSPAAFQALVTLSRAQPLAPHEIGAALHVTRGAVTGLLDSLERQGLVVRLPHPADRRMLQVELTRPGVELVREVEREHQEGERQLLGCLDPGERDTLFELLSKLQNHLVRL